MNLSNYNFVFSNFICFYEKYERKALSLTNTGTFKKKLSSSDKPKEKDNSFFQALIGRLSGQEKARTGTEKIELLDIDIYFQLQAFDVFSFRLMDHDEDDNRDRSGNINKRIDFSASTSYEFFSLMIRIKLVTGTIAVPSIYRQAPRSIERANSRPWLLT